MKIFEDSIHENEHFKGLNCANADLTGYVFRECEFSGCDFSSSNLGKGQFSECSFEDCNLSNVNVASAKLNEVAFISCKLAGIDFTSCNQMLFSINIRKSKVAYCLFTGLRLSGRTLSHSELTDCIFEGADLSRALLLESNFEGSAFERTNLQAADFRGATNYAIDPRENNIRKAIFSTPEVLHLLKPFGIVIKNL